MAKTILAIELLMGVMLLVGMLPARAKRFRAHGVCQSAVILLNLVPIITFMVPSFRSGYHCSFHGSKGHDMYGTVIVTK